MHYLSSSVRGDTLMFHGAVKIYIHMHACKPHPTHFSFSSYFPSQTSTGRPKPKSPRSDFALRMCFLRSPCHCLEKPHCSGRFEYEDFNCSVASAPRWHAGRGCSVCCHAWTQPEFIQHTLQRQKNWHTEASYFGSCDIMWNTLVNLLGRVWEHVCISK